MYFSNSQFTDSFTPATTVRAAWTAEDIDNAENRQPVSDLAADSSYYRQDGRRNGNYV